MTFLLQMLALIAVIYDGIVAVAVIVWIIKYIIKDRRGYYD